MTQISKANRESAEDLESLEIPYDDPCNFPVLEPQPRCLYDDCIERGRPIGYSSLPANVRTVSFFRDKYPLGSQAIEAFNQMKEKFLWWDDILYWTDRFWFLRVVFRDGSQTGT
jgi:hypothetical protein